MLVIFTADYKWLASAACVIKKENIYVYLELILVQVDIVRWDWVWKSIQILTVKHFFIVKSISTAMLFLEIGSFEEVENLVAKAALMIVLNVYYIFLIC